MPDSPLKLLIRSEGMAYLPVLRALSDELQGRDYHFLPHSEYERLLFEDFPSAMEVYWSEILFRAHWAASVSVLRIHRWLQAAEVHMQSPNILGFSSAVRGLLESAADSCDALIDVALSLAEMRVTVQKALRRELQAVVVSPKLEDMLIHFTHARKIQKGEAAPASHRAKTTRDYLERLNRVSDGRAGEAYAFLCEITHPAATSVYLFTEPTEDESQVTLRSDLDGMYIGAFCEEHSKAFLEAMYLGINPALMTLKVLNRFTPAEVQTIHMRAQVVGGIPGWAMVNSAWLASTEVRGSSDRPNSPEA